MNKIHEKIGIAVLLFGMLMFFIVIGSPPAAYHIVYRPIYSIGGDVFFLAFYIKLFKTLMMMILCSCVFYFLIKKLPKMDNKNIFASIILVLLISFYIIINSRDFFYDTKLVYQGRYETAESYISQIYSSSSRRSGRNYQIRTIDEKGTLSLNVYQYRHLESMKQDYNKKAKIRLYYLPNTTQVLQYELLDK